MSVISPVRSRYHAARILLNNMPPSRGGEVCCAQLHSLLLNIIVDDIQSRVTE